MKKKLLLMALFAMFSFGGFAQTEVEAYPVPDIVQCNNELFDLTVQTPITLGNQDTETHTVTYYVTESDAQAATNAIADTTLFVPDTWPQTIYIRVENGDGTFDITSFAVYVLSTPWFQEFEDVMVCGSYQIPEVYNGNCYTGPGGTGELLEAGTMITESTTIYVYGSNDCGTDETSFNVTINAGTVNTAMPTPLKVCSFTLGNAIFDLQPAIDQIQGMNEEAVTITFHETYEDAVENTNAIPNISSYANTIPWQMTLSMRVQFGECIVILPLELYAITCETNSTISGYVTFDADGDGCSENDPPAAGVLVYYQNDNIYNYTYTDSNGFYIFYNVPNAFVNVYAEALYPMESSTFPDSYGMQMENGSAMGNDFCLSVPEDVTDVSVYLVETSAAQPGFPATYALIYQNCGSTVASGNITVEFNDEQLDFVATSSPDVVPSGTNAITMNYSDLQPFSFQIVYLEFLVAVPGIVDLGDTITFTSTITPIEGDDYPENNVNVLNQIAVNSWDPNDYMVYEGAEITMDQADDYLTYRIRFQNMGNANANFVIIETELDDKLDWDTFQPLSASHDYVTNRTNNQVEFFFDDIQLTGAEINEPDSHGFIIFRIKPKPNVEIGDIMDGQAFNYFDFNPAEPTNIVSTEIVELAGIENNGLTHFTIYPNPASSTLTVDFTNETVNTFNVSIVDALGKTVLNSSYNGVRADINISSLQTGVYFVTTSANGKQATKKLIVK